MRVITVSRKPCAAGSLTSNVVEYGAGAINVTDTTIGTKWPANSFLIHPPGCKIKGEKTVPGYLINRWVDGAKPFGGGAGHDYESEMQPEQTLQLWDCVSGCPVKRLAPTDYSCFKHFQPQEGLFVDMLEYLYTLIAPPKDAAPFLMVYEDLAEAPWDMCGDQTVHGLITKGDPTEYLEKIDRVLKPGAHVLIVSSEEDPMGIDSACAIEEFGYEIRDSIACFEHEGEHHYFSKPSPKERHCGVEPWFDPNIQKTVHNNQPCLHPDALVMTAKGYRPLVEMQEGDLVYAQDGKFHLVEYVSRHPYPHSVLYEVQVLGTNYTTKASNNHPFLIWRPVRQDNRVIGGDVVWLEAHEVQRGDYTMTPLMAENPSPQPVPAEMFPYVEDEEFWFLFGLYLAEGVAQSAGHGDSLYPSYTLGDHETELHLRVDAYFSHVKVGIYEKKEGAAVQIIPFDQEAGRLFVELGGRGAQNKRLSESLWSLSTCCREAIFEGYMAGDGGDVRNHRECKSVSQDLASQMRLLAEGLGYKANLFRYPGRAGGIGNRKFKKVRPVHHVRFYSRNQTLQTRKPSRPTYVKHEGQKYLLRYVKKVAQIPYEGDVMNLSVEGNPTFMTPVGMTHNTVKPVGLMMSLLKDVPKDQGLVVDPFLGSGTTALACLRTRHEFLGIEQSERYASIADQRIRYWGGAINGWEGLELTSDVAVEEASSEPMTLDEFFGFVPEKGE